MGKMCNVHRLEMVVCMENIDSTRLHSTRLASTSKEMNEGEKGHIILFIMRTAHNSIPALQLHFKQMRIQTHIAI